MRHEQNKKSMDWTRCGHRFDRLQKESQVITGPVVLVLNAVNSSDEEPVEGCYPQLTIYIRPGRTVAAE